nr:reverse transcriptase domain-containing protein [Tanacetum cinerariifolium]
MEEDDLSQPWVCEEIDPFTPMICYFDLPKTRMPNHIKTYDESKDLEDHIKIFQAVTKTKRWAMLTWCHMFNSTLMRNMRGEGSGTPTEPHHTPFPDVETSHPTPSSIPLPSIPTVPIPPITQPVTTPIIQYSRRARIAQSSALPTVVDEPASPVRDVSEGEACPTESGFIADQDRATIV